MQRLDISQGRRVAAPASRLGHEGYRRFRDAMDNGRLKPGMTVTQDELCRVLKLSLTPLREALVLLEEYGLVEVLPRKGLRLTYPDLDFIRDNFQFRHVIEVHALRLFAQSDNIAFLADMRLRHEAVIADFAAPHPAEAAISRMVEIDRLFHRTIVGVLHNPAISLAHERLQGNIGMVRLTQARAPFRGQLQDTAHEHMKVIEALEQNDTDSAVAALEAHFRASTYRTFA